MEVIQFINYRMGTEKRDRETKSIDLKNRPGPGSYISKSFIGEGPKIGMKARNYEKNNHTSVSPGPGSYQPNISVVIKKPPMVGLGHGKRGDIANDDNKSFVPGPGHYPIKGSQEGPKFGFGTGKREAAKISNVPGPGRYNIPSTVGELPAHEKSKHN